MNEELGKCDCDFEQHNPSEELFGQCTKEELIQQIQQLTSTVNSLIDEKQLLQYQLEFQKYIIINNNENGSVVHNLTPIPEVTCFGDSESNKLPNDNSGVLHELGTDPFPSNVIFDEDEDRDNSCSDDIITEGIAIDEHNLLIPSADGLEDSFHFDDFVESDWISRVNEVDTCKGDINELSNLNLELISSEIIPSVGEEQTITTSAADSGSKVLNRNNTSNANTGKSAEFKCNICSNTYKYNFSLKRHMSQQHQISNFVSSRKVDEQKPIDVSAWIENRKTDVNENNENLPVKGNEEQTKRANEETVPASKKRKRRKKKVMNLICELCGETFRYMYNYQRHIKKLHLENDENFPCTLCSKVFPSRKSFKRHQNKVHLSPETKNFQCHYCLELFKFHYILQRHVARLHDTSYRVSCTICPKTFPTEYHLRRHLALHEKKSIDGDGKGQAQADSDTSSTSSKKKPPRNTISTFVCEFCGKIFPKKNRLVQHCVSHAVKKPFGCQLCEKSFTRKAKLIQHQTRRHFLEDTSVKKPRGINDVQ